MKGSRSRWKAEMPFRNRKTGRAVIYFILAACIWILPGCRSEKEIKEFTAFFNVPGDEIDENNEIKKKIAEITGAECKEIWLAGQTPEKAVSSLIAGGEYPDFISADAQLYEAGVLVPLDEYWDDYPNIKNFLSEEKWERFRQEDGHIYRIPQFGIANGKTEGVIHNDEAFWIQTRVLKWAGYPKIETLDEYFALLEAYAKENPTMENGLENIAFTVLCDGERYFCLENPPQFLEGYPNDGSVIVEPDTQKVRDYSTTQTAQRYFRKLNEEFQKGYLDPEFFTQTYQEYLNKLSSGQVLGMVDQWWRFAYDINAVLERQELWKEGCNYVPLPITIDKGIKNQWHTIGGDMYNVAEGLAVTVSCEDLAGALSFVNDLLSPEVQTLRLWGIEGVDYEVDAEGIFYLTEEQSARSTDSEYSASHFCSYSYFPRYEGLNPDGINAYSPEVQPGEFFKGLPQDVKDCFDAYGCRNYVEMLGSNEKPGPWFPMYSYSAQLTSSSRAGEVWAAMTEVKQEYLPRVVMAEDFDTAWNEYMEEYTRCEPEVYLEEMQAEVERRVAAGDSASLLSK